MNSINKFTNGVTSGIVSTMEKTKDWQLELLMEKLRSKSSQFKSFGDTAKVVRMTLMDKRFVLNTVEKSQHQKCLDALQHCIKVTSLQSMVERLESLTRQLGLKFMAGPSGVELFISSDMFYLEIVLDQSGAVRDVKVHHEGKMEQQSCAELVNCLSRGDFADFTAQLEGFASIYKLNAEKTIKCKAFTVLQSLESDLNTLAQLQTFMKEPFNLIHKSPVGILEKRKGGHPMKLTYFVSPYDLLDVEKGDMEAISIDTVTNKNLGYSVTVCMEGSEAHKLQTTTLITINRNVNGKSTPSFAGLTNQNSTVIPACFILRLNKPMPMCVVLVRQIQQLTELECVHLSITQPLLNLITTHASDGKIECGNGKGLFVTLPDQHHCYFTTENKNMEGVLIQSIPFTHPSHVSRILVILRQQALFNTLITSCVRPASKPDFENMIMFEISALSWTHISISLEHPIEENMATAELDLSDISNLSCLIHSPNTPPPPNTPDAASELATKVLNRCFSIPITMRAVIKLWDKQVVRRNHFSGHENFNLPLGSGDPGGHKGPPSNNLTEFGNLDGKIKPEASSSNGHGMNLSHPHQGMFLNENFSNFSAVEPSISSILTNIELTNILAGTSQDKPLKRHHKRKANDDIWKNSKRKPGDESELLLETSSSDSTSRSTPLSHDTISEASITPNSGLGFQSDMELSSLDPCELVGASDKPLSEFDNMDELGDVEELLTGTLAKELKNRRRDMQKSPSSILDLGENKSLVPPSVSITPISSSLGPQVYNSNLSLDRRPGIEIIPIATTSPTSLPSSITITPILSSQIKSMDDRSREKKSSKRSDDKNKLEKKRKRKREDSPMGPPDKVPPKQDPLSKPVSVSIKPTESPPSTPTSPSSLARKFSQSPTQSRNLSLSGKLSPSMLKPSLKTGTSHPSPKHSPGHIPNSPKHSIPGISSPKNHGTSPKHPSTSGSGKPSMSTLKNAANSPSSKSSNDALKNKSINKDSSRDKDKKSSNFSLTNKIKSSSVKLKQLDLTTGDMTNISQVEGLPSPSATSDITKSNLNQVRNRKGSLSAVIDKLKSAQHDNITDLSKSSGNKDRTTQLINKISDGNKSIKVGETKNSEYMVKPSSDGMKITINKTRTKDSMKLSGILTKTQLGNSGSPKIHTGLKPGVNSGPASKKPQLSQKSGLGLNAGALSGHSSTNINKSQTAASKSSNSPSLGGGISKSISKLSGSPKTGSSNVADLSRNKDRPRLNKSSSDKSIFSSSRERRLSPMQNRDESETEKAFKLAITNPYSTPLVVDGLTKQFDKNFQIPKKSARVTDDRKLSCTKSNTNTDSISGINRTVDQKMFEMSLKNDITVPKYPLTLPTNKVFENNDTEMKFRNSIVSTMSSNAMSFTTTTSSPKLILHSEMNTSDLSDLDKKKDVQNSSVKDESYKINFPLSVTKSFSTSNSEPLGLMAKSVDLTPKFITPAPKDEKKEQKPIGKEVNDLCLDFTKDKVTGNNSLKSESSLPPPPPYPASPSVSVHIVKSPAPSPLINPSPHSPCITDDELMDEALVGLGK